MVNPLELLRQLSDGAFYSGQKLAAQHGVSRMTIYHSMSRLAELGVAVVRVRGRGYRLSRPIDLLDERIILSRLEPYYASHIGGLEVLAKLDSTSSYLLRRADQGAPGGLVCLAEYQTAGKGRRGRRWVSPFGSNLYLSLMWRFDAYSAELSGLSLLVGLAVAGMIRDLGGKDICLKWPNDIICHRQKLGRYTAGDERRDGGALPCCHRRWAKRIHANDGRTGYRPALDRYGECSLRHCTIAQ